MALSGSAEGTVVRAVPSAVDTIQPARTAGSM